MQICLLQSPFSPEALSQWRRRKLWLHFGELHHFLPKWKKKKQHPKNHKAFWFNDFTEVRKEAKRQTSPAMSYVIMTGKFKIPTPNPKKKVSSLREPSFCRDREVYDEKLAVRLRRVLELKYKGGEGFEKTVIYTHRTKLFPHPEKLSTPTKMKYHPCSEFSQVYFIELYYSVWNELTEELQSKYRCFRSPISPALENDTSFRMFSIREFYRCAAFQEAWAFSFLLINKCICPMGEGGSLTRNDVYHWKKKTSCFWILYCPEG